MAATARWLRCKVCGKAYESEGFYKNDTTCKVCRKREKIKRCVVPDATEKARLKWEAVAIIGEMSCKECGKVKPLSEFYVVNNRQDYVSYAPVCKVCSNERKRERRGGHHRVLGTIPGLQRSRDGVLRFMGRAKLTVPDEGYQLVVCNDRCGGCLECANACERYPGAVCPQCPCLRNPWGLN